MTKKRTICFIVTSHIHYARSRSLIQAIARHPDLDLRVAVAASAILQQYGDVLAAMKEDGVQCAAKIVMTLAGGSTVAMAKTAGIGVTEFATAFDNIQPDMVFIRGDRYEVLAAAVAACYMNIPIAHLEGGDLSGSIDESVRHAVTKLAHIHLTTNEESAGRVRQLGEHPESVHVVGSPELEELLRDEPEITSEELNHLGVGAALDLRNRFLIVMMHPVTTEMENRAHADTLLDVVAGMQTQTVWFWPNVDAGTDDIAKGIRVFREQRPAPHMHFIKYLAPGRFVALLKKSACLVGNSSAGIKECSFLGVPAVNVGSRQNGRMRGPNVIDVGHDSRAIRAGIEQQLRHGRYPSSNLYFRRNTAASIAEILATVKLTSQKQFYSLPADVPR